MKIFNFLNKVATHAKRSPNLFAGSLLERAKISEFPLTAMTGELATHKGVTDSSVGTVLMAVYNCITAIIAGIAVFVELGFADAIIIGYVAQYIGRTVIEMELALLGKDDDTCCNSLPVNDLDLIQDTLIKFVTIARDIASFALDLTAQVRGYAGPNDWYMDYDNVIVTSNTSFRRLMRGIFGKEYEDELLRYRYDELMSVPMECITAYMGTHPLDDDPAYARIHDALTQAPLCPQDDTNFIAKMIMIIDMHELPFGHKGSLWFTNWALPRRNQPECYEASVQRLVDRRILQELLIALLARNSVSGDTTESKINYATKFFVDYDAALRSYDAATEMITKYHKYCIIDD